jgi:hypothetical protein
MPHDEDDEPEMEKEDDTVRTTEFVIAALPLT